VYGRQLACVGLAVVTFYGLLAILWAFWFFVFIDVMGYMTPRPHDWVFDLLMGGAIVSGLALYFFAVRREVSLVMKCPASQANGLVALSGTLPLVSFAVLVWWFFNDFNVLSY